MKLLRENSKKEAYKTLTLRAISMGYEVKETVTDPDSCDFNAGIITINRNNKLANKLWALAHELGHILYRQDKRLYTRKRIPDYTKLDKMSEFGVDNIIDEEIGAWCKADDIIVQLSPSWRYGSEYQKTKYKCLQNYFSYRKVKEQLESMKGGADASV